MIHTRIALVVLVALSAACKNSASSTGGGSSKSSGSNEVVATFTGGQITLKELDAELGEQLFQLRKGALDRLIVQKLVAPKAKAANQTEEQWLAQNVDSLVQDSDVQALYEEFKARIPPNLTFDQVKGQLRDMAKQRKATAVFEKLQQESGVKVLLAPPRIEVAATGPSRGPNGAKVTIVEFSDFQCPFCSKASETVEEVMKQYAGKVRLVFRHYPLPFHSEAPKAAEASLCANEQGKFWEMHDQLFKNQQALAVANLETYAQSIGLDAPKFKDCLGQAKFKTAVDKDMAEGQKAGVRGTPAFFINGQLISGAQPVEEFKKLIDAELAK